MSDVTDKAPKARVHPVGVGMPHWLLLNSFGTMAYRAFGTYPLLVGSALSNRDPRDIDVRLVLSDSQFDQLFGMGSLNQAGTGWADTCIVWSAYATTMVAKAVDFQIQSDTAAILYKGQLRLPLGTAPWTEA